MNPSQELLDIAKIQAQEYKELSELFLLLTASPAWNKLKELAEKQVQVRMTQVMTQSDFELRQLNPPTNVDRLCGEACGIRLVLQFPETFLTAMEKPNGLESETESTE